MFLIESGHPNMSSVCFLRDCLADLFGNPLLWSLQHSHRVQQAGDKLPQASAGCRGHLALLSVLDRAPSAGLEQLWHRGGWNQLLCVLDGADGPVTRLHHLPLHFLPGYTGAGDDLLLQQAAVVGQTGREMSPVHAVMSLSISSAQCLKHNYMRSRCRQIILPWRSKNILQGWVTFSHSVTKDGWQQPLAVF